MPRASQPKEEDLPKMFLAHIGVMALLVIQTFAIFRGMDMSAAHENCPNEVGLFGKHQVRTSVYYFELFMQLSMSIALIIALGLRKIGPIMFWMLWMMTFIFLALGGLFYDFYIGIQSTELQDINLLILTFIMSCLQILIINNYYTESLWTKWMGLYETDAEAVDVEWKGQAEWRDKIWKEMPTTPKVASEIAVFKV